MNKLRQLSLLTAYEQRGSDQDQEHGPEMTTQAAAGRSGIFSHCASANARAKRGRNLPALAPLNHQDWLRMERCLMKAFKAALVGSAIVLSSTFAAIAQQPSTPPGNQNKSPNMSPPGRSFPHRTLASFPRTQRTAVRVPLARRPTRPSRTRTIQAQISRSWIRKGRADSSSKLLALR